jgi:WD40 repeat protein
VHASGKVHVWDLPTLGLVGVFEAPLKLPDTYSAVGSSLRWRRLAVSPNASQVAVAGWNRIDVWDMNRCELATTVRLEPTVSARMLALAFASDTTLTTIGRADPAPVVTWDLLTNRIVERARLVMPRAEYFERALLTPDHQRLIAADGDRVVVWRLDCPWPIAHADIGTAGQALAVSSDGTRAATSTADGLLRLWSLHDLREIDRWNLRELGCRDISCALAFTPDARRLIVGGWEGVLRSVVLPSS